MKRQIFEVQKKIYGSAVGGYLANPSGYPKIFDSHAAAYHDDVDAALLAATAAFAGAWQEICSVTNNREIQTVLLMTVDGFIIDKKTVGHLEDIPDEDS